MPVLKSFALGNGDMFYIRHASDNFTIIDCNVGTDDAEAISDELKDEAAGKGIARFISTHPEDHCRGIWRLDDAMPIQNFYVVRSDSLKDPKQPHSGNIARSAMGVRLYT